MPIQRDAVQDAQTISAIEAAAQSNNIPRAVELARAALADGLVRPMLLNLRAHWFERQGRHTESLADLEHAVMIAPTDLLVRNAYGAKLAGLERYAEALAVQRETVSLAPDYSGAHFRLGCTLELSGELVEARDAYERAAALDPFFAPVQVHLASLAFRRSDFAAARAYANRALALEPGSYAARMNLAQAALAEGEIDEAENIITPLMGRRAETPHDAATARRVLGDVRHAQGRYSQAFAAYTQSNVQRHALYAEQLTTPGTMAIDYARWLTAYFEDADAAQWSAKRASAQSANLGDDHGGAKSHALLVGFPRSGTTLLENVLKSHPDAVTLEEKDTLGDLMRTYLVNDHGRDVLAAMPAAAAAALRPRYWDRVAAFGVDVAGKTFIDKYPLATLRLPLIAKIMPGAKVLFAVRDPRDVVLSCYRRNFMMNTSMFEFLEITRTAHYYAAVQAAAKVFREKLGLDWLQLRNEDLVEDFEGEARKICDFLGLEWSAAMANFAEDSKTRTIRTPSSVQVVKGLNADGVGVWRHYAKEMEPALAILKPWIEAYGYPAE
jgi:Flp pilus assembly protein TadD